MLATSHSFQPCMWWLLLELHSPSVGMLSMSCWEGESIGVAFLQFLQFLHALYSGVSCWAEQAIAGTGAG